MRRGEERIMVEAMKMSIVGGELKKVGCCRYEIG